MKKITALTVTYEDGSTESHQGTGIIHYVTTYKVVEDPVPVGEDRHPDTHNEDVHYMDVTFSPTKT